MVSAPDSGSGGPGSRRSNTPSRFMLRKPELSTGPMGHLGPYKGFTTLKNKKITV